MKSNFYSIFLLNFCILTIFMTKIVSSGNGAIKLFIRTGGHRHRKDDFFFIPGKGCKTPMILIKGGRKLLHVGKTIIIIQEDCAPDVAEKKVFKLITKEQEHGKHNQDNNIVMDLIPVPIPIPVFMHYYHIPVEQNYMHHMPEWTPYADQIKPVDQPIDRPAHSPSPSPAAQDNQHVIHIPVYQYMGENGMHPTEYNNPVPPAPADNNQLGQNIHNYLPRPQ